MSIITLLLLFSFLTNVVLLFLLIANKTHPYLITGIETIARNKKAWGDKELAKFVFKQR